VQVLIRELQDPDPEVRREAAGALGEMGDDAVAAIPALLQALKDPAQEVAEQAGTSLMHLGRESEAAVPLLVRAWLTEEDDHVLGELDGNMEEMAYAGVVPALAALANDPDEKLRLRAVEKFGLFTDGRHFPEETVAAVPALVGFLNDSSSRVRAAAATTLGVIGPAAAQVRPQEDTVLGQGEPTASEVVRALVRALRDPDPQVRQALAAPLAQALSESEEATRQEVIPLLEQAGPPAVPFLCKLIRYGGDAPAAAAKALGRVGPEARAAVPVLLAALREWYGSSSPWSEAALALGQIGFRTEEIIVPLINLLPTPEGGDAAEVLSTFDPYLLVPSLIDAMNEGDDNLHRAAERFLMSMGRHALPGLCVAMESPSDMDRRVAISFLRDLGSHAREALPVVIEALDDRDERVQETAATILDSLGEVQRRKG
jgi:HEAT repeat protein